MISDDVPLVSIVTPSYNQGLFIEATLLSIKNQDYPKLEHVVIDGGSSDNTIEILKNYEREYNLKWISERDKGQSDAINKGFEAANGDIIGWLNSDDVYFDKRVISYVVNEFQRLSEIDVIYGDGIRIDDENMTISVHHIIPWFNYNRLLRQNFIFQPSSFFRRRVIQKHKLDVNLDFNMDYEYWLRLAGDGFRFKHANRILAAFRIHRAAKSRARKRDPKAKVEVEKIRQLYGYNFNISYYPHRLLDRILAVYLKIYGAKTMMLLCANPQKFDLAFLAKFNSPLSGVISHLTLQTPSKQF
ncbi:MAG: glycosyltransferase family 2 protein [Candidatus Hodarchaeota archaeon]